MYLLAYTSGAVLRLAATALSLSPRLHTLTPSAIVTMQGTAKRWEQVAAYVRTRTMDDVIEMAKHGLAARAPVNDSFSILKKHQGNIVINSDATARNEVFTDVQVNLSGEARCTSSPTSAQTPYLLSLRVRTKAECVIIGIAEFGGLDEVVNIIGNFSVLMFVSRPVA